MNKKNQVKNYFENTSKYLDDKLGGISIYTRRKIIESFFNNKKVGRLLDMPCGDGMVSVNLTQNAKSSLLMDIAENMVELAKVNHRDSKNTKFIAADFDKYNFESELFDSILAIGILAHVDSPENFINSIDKLLNKNGYLVVQNTDNSHFSIRLLKMLRGQKKLVQKDSYELNPISSKWLVAYLKSKGYKLVESYRYETRTPFLKRAKTLEQKVKSIWYYFGTPPSNRNGFFGSKCIYMFQKQ